MATKKSPTGLKCLCADVRSVKLLLERLGRIELQQLAALSARELHATVHAALIATSVCGVPLNGEDGKLYLAVRPKRAKKMVAGRVRPAVKRKH